MGEDVGYGPARALLPREVATISNALDRVTRSAFEERFDAGLLTNNNVYPEIWGEGEKALEYLATNFEELKRFYQNAAQAGYVVLAYLN